MIFAGKCKNFATLKTFISKTKFIFRYGNEETSQEIFIYIQKFGHSKLNSSTLYHVPQSDAKKSHNGRNFIAGIYQNRDKIEMYHPIVVCQYVIGLIFHFTRRGHSQTTLTQVW